MKYLFIVNLVELTIFVSRWLFLKVVASSYSFVFTDRKNNQFQKKLITAEHEYEYVPPPYRAGYATASTIFGIKAFANFTQPRTQAL